MSRHANYTDHYTLFSIQTGAIELLSGNIASTNHTSPLSGELSRDRKQTTVFPTLCNFRVCDFWWLLDFPIVMHKGTIHDVIVCALRISWFSSYAMLLINGGSRAGEVGTELLCLAYLCNLSNRLCGPGVWVTKQRTAHTGPKYVSVLTGGGRNAERAECRRWNADSYCPISGGMPKTGGTRKWKRVRGKNQVTPIVLVNVCF